MRSLLVIASLLFALPVHAEVTIEWVTVGHPENAADTASNCYFASCGAVSVTYRMARYEVTNTQYVEFLNSKAATDTLGLYNTAMGSESWGGTSAAGAPGATRTA